jgi:O-antigen ligase
MWIMAALLLVLVGADMFALDLSLAPGLSVKNAGIYLLLAMLALRMALTGRAQLETRSGLIMPFAILVGYALLTTLLSLLVIHPPDFHARDAAIALKSTLIDHATFFVAFFLALASKEQAILLLKVLAAGIATANVGTVLHVLGVVDLPGMSEGLSGAEEGRIHGVFGHANETAAVIVAVLPLLLALAAQSRSAARVLWGGGFLMSAAVLVMTGSRGGLLALGAGTLIAMVLCREYLPMGRVVTAGFATLAISIALLLVLNPQSLDVVADRLVSQTMSSDIGDASSGRTDIWGAAFSVMMSQPFTLISGFGWYMYETLPFHFAPHNHYLWLWFNLGLVGVGTFIFMLQRVISMVRRAIPPADEVTRSYLIAFVFGLMGFAFAVFFSNIYRPWLYIWAAIGITMRLALFVMDEGPAKVPAAQTAAPGARVVPKLRYAGSRVGEIRRRAS